MAPYSETFLTESVGDYQPLDNRSDPPQTNGISPQHPWSNIKGHPTHSKYQERSPYLSPAKEEDEHDLICVGVGPASLAIAVALHDAMASGSQIFSQGSSPRILFIEKQAGFAWHAGMRLAGAKMQISFVKDLATLRNPRSEFTFLNYLHRQGRLVDFTNLGTFLPTRAEYEDYMLWAASFFEPVIRYSNEVMSVSPEARKGTGPVQNFTVLSRCISTGNLIPLRSRNVLFATGGQPSLPKSFPQCHPRVIHSSQYAQVVPQLLPDCKAVYRIAVVGGGQSAAEIFNDVQKLYSNSQIRLIMRQEFLRPSDDSPFINAIFNPDFVDSTFPRAPRHRFDFLADVRATNYGVARLELIEEIYERMYEQRRKLGPDESLWPIRILGGRRIKGIEPLNDGGPINIQLQKLISTQADNPCNDCESFQADILIAATGYRRTAHVDMLESAWTMLPKAEDDDAECQKGIAGWNVNTEQGEHKLAVGRNYQVQFIPGTVAKGSGIWLQGCCEGTHGLSDTLLSVLPTRSGEIINSIFGEHAG